MKKIITVAASLATIFGFAQSALAGLSFDEIDQKIAAEPSRLETYENSNAERQIVVDFSDTDVGDEIIDYLIERGYMENITNLNLNNTKVTNAGIKKLAECISKRVFKNLLSIRIQNIDSDLSEGVEEFAKALAESKKDEYCPGFDGLFISEESVKAETRELISEMRENEHIQGGFVDFRY